jgi:hypothetical protein
MVENKVLGADNALWIGESDLLEGRGREIMSTVERKRERDNKYCRQCPLGR